MALERITNLAREMLRNMPAILKINAESIFYVKYYTKHIENNKSWPRG